MITKSELLSNLREYTSDQIADAILAGTVTLYELSKSGNLTPLMRRRIEEKIAEKKALKVEETSEEGQNIVENASPNRDGEGISDDDFTMPKVTVNDIATELAVEKSQETNQPVETSSNEIESEDKVKSSSSDISNKGMFKRPFSFKGRIRRTEYGITFIIYFMWYSIFMAVGKSYLSDEVAVVLVLSMIPILWLIWAQSCKRCHDRGHSGWYQLIPFYVFVLLFGEGDKEANEYGDNPK